MVQNADSRPFRPLDRMQVVQELLTRLGRGTYLEIGVQLGESLLPIKAGLKLGVDPALRIPWLKRMALAARNRLLDEEVRLFEMTSDRFFADNVPLLSDRKIDVALVDGLHTYAQSLRDVENCLRFLSPRGVVVMHDCNPPTEAIGRPAPSHAEAMRLNYPDLGRTWCGDVWKAVVHLRTVRQDVRAFVLDSDLGIGIVLPGKSDGAPALRPQDLDSMTYRDFDRDRRTLLDLRSPEYFWEFLRTVG